MPTAPTARTARHLLDRGFAPADALTRATDRAVLDPDGQAPAPLSGREMLVAWKDLAKDVRWDLPSGVLDAVVAAQDPLALATALIAAKYAELGGNGGLLGSTSTAVTACPDGVGFFRHYQHGSIYWHPLTGAHEVHGALRARWAELGWERSFLGYPTSDELAGRDPAAVGRVSHFAGGSLYWRPAPTGPRAAGAAAPAAGPMTAGPRPSAGGRPGRPGMFPGPRAGELEATAERLTLPPRSVFEVHGAIRSRYLALGGEGSILGYPTTDETATPDGVGRFNHFQAGSIYWTPSTSAHEVHGLIRALWAAGGWERDPGLGYPLTDELVPDRRVGHRRPESIRKPVRALPSDVVKLPASAAAGGFEATIVNLPMARPVRPVRETHTVAAAERSPHRFGDFEDGVVFWHRGAPTAVRVTPWRPDGGTGPTLGSGTVVTAARAILGRALTSGPGLDTVSFAGTTGYTWDGVGTHLRRHRLTVRLQDPTSSGGGGFFGDVLDAIGNALTDVTLEVHAEVGFDPVDRTVSVALVSWQPLSIGAHALSRHLHGRLDPVLWQNSVLRDLTEARGTRPVAVLSVKVRRDGGIDIYLEPDRVLDLSDVVGDVTSGVHGLVRDAHREPDRGGLSDTVRDGALGRLTERPSGPVRPDR